MQKQLDCSIKRLGLRVASDVNSHFHLLARSAPARPRELSMTQRYARLSPDHMKRIASLTLRRPAAKVLEIAQGRNG